MGAVINGAGSQSMQPVMSGTLSIKNAGYADQVMRTVRQSKNNRITKRLNYNHREISGQLVRAKKVQSASTVLTRAKGKLASLQRCAGTGQYDRREVTNAIAHARRMVRCAQLKVKHLKEEESEQKSHQKKSGNEAQERKNEIKRRAAQKERSLEQKIDMELAQQAQKEKSRQIALAQKRRMHRSEERGKITEADMKYLKGQTENDRSQTGDSQMFDSGVFLELSAAAAELAMEEELLKQEAEMEIEAELGELEGAQDLGTTPDASAGMTETGTAPIADGAVQGVDVSV